MSVTNTDVFSGWLTPTRIFDGSRMHDNLSVYIRDGIVKRLACTDESAHVVDGIVSPGFFDLQVNGGGGVLFNNDPTTDGIRQIARAHRERGTSHMLPTVITDTAGVLEKACHAVLESHDEQGVTGIHLEGPHISPDKAGVHRKSDIRPLDTHTIGLLRLLRDRNVPALITVAPESVQPGQIAALVQMGVVVSLGHSNAAARDVQRCVAEGATLFTHLYNAMSPMTGRAPGMVGTAINSEAYCSIICDGKHVAPDMLKIAINARPRHDRMIIVSDAMPTVGGGSSFQLYGETITRSENTLRNPQGALAGAHITMAASIEYLHQVVGLNLEHCLQMAVTYPRELMNEALMNEALINEARTNAALMSEATTGGLVGQSVADCIVVPTAPSQTRALVDYLADTR